GRLHVVLDALDEKGNFIDGANTHVKVTGQDTGGKDANTLPMTQIAPGRYGASLPTGQGTYWLSADLCENQSEGKLLESVSGATVVQVIPQTIVKLDGSVSAAEKTGLQTNLVWPWFLGAAVVLLIIDLAVRRTAKP